MKHHIAKRTSNIFCFAFLSALIAFYFLDKLPLAILSFYGTMSIFAFVMYGWDKYAAIKGWGRIRERTLHVLSLFSGWPGAAMAQQSFRHKTKKAAFRRLYWLTVAINIGCLYWLYSQQQSLWFKTLLNVASKIGLT